MEQKQINIMGIDLTEWTHESCTAHIATGDDWATVYHIESQEQGRGHGTALLVAAKEFYEAQGKKFGSTITLSPAMAHLLKKLEIHEYA